MAFVFVASTAFAAEQVADADGITITADTTDEAIARLWGEGAAAISQNDDGSYTFKLLKNISLAKYQDISIGNFQARRGAAAYYFRFKRLYAFRHQYCNCQFRQFNDYGRFRRANRPH